MLMFLNCPVLNFAACPTLSSLLRQLTSASKPCSTAWSESCSAMDCAWPFCDPYSIRKQEDETPWGMITWTLWTENEMQDICHEPCNFNTEVIPPGWTSTPSKWPIILGHTYIQCSALILLLWLMPFLPGRWLPDRKAPLVTDVADSLYWNHVTL